MLHDDDDVGPKKQRKDAYGRGHLTRLPSFARECEIEAA
jgi:hypothetical protein